MGKNLPIKIFYKRENDELVTEGSGNSDKPKWTLSGESLKGKSAYFTDKLHTIEARFQRKIVSKDFMPALVKFKVNDDAFAKTYRKNISKLFSVNQKINVVGLIGDSELLVKIDNQADLNSILERFNNYAANDVAISALEDTAVFKPIKYIEDNKENNLKVKLIDYQDKELNNLLENKFESFCAEHKIACKKINYGSDLRIYSLDRTCLDFIDDIEDFDGIFSLTEVPEIEVTLDSMEEELEHPILEPNPNKTYPVVGVLDSGIARNKYLSPWVIEKEFVPFDNDDINPSHGTFVSGIIAYGDNLEQKVMTGTEGCMIFNATVFPKGYWDEFNLVEKIKEAIETHPEIKVWNLSLGTKNEADLDSFSDFGKALDELQDRYDILIVKSAGNCENFTKGIPKSRISMSADSVRSLVVGSISHEKTESDHSEINNPSPFSRMGPGPANIVKPELVHYGGNAGMKDGKLVTTGVTSFSPNGKIMKNVGTSFSTPRVAAMAANLGLNLEGTFNPLLTKALLLHSAKYPEELDMSMEDRLKHTGYGLPSNVEDIIFNDEDEITLIMQDTIEKGKFINVMDFPFPDSLVEDGYYYGEVTITLVTDPILAKNQGNEYCQSNIDVYFGSFDEKKDRDTDQRTIKNPIGTEGNKNFLNESLFSKRIIKDLSNSFNSERVLINHHKKFQPIKKWVINLEEMTEGNKERYLKAPKKWFLKLEALFRYNSEVIAEKNSRDLSVDYALIITIKDSRKKGNLYNQVNQLLEQFNFLHTNIKLNEKIRLQTGG